MWALYRLYGYIRLNNACDVEYTVPFLVVIRLNTTLQLLQVSFVYICTNLLILVIIQIYVTFHNKSSLTPMTFCLWHCWLWLATYQKIMMTSQMCLYLKKHVLKHSDTVCTICSLALTACLSQVLEFNVLSLLVQTVFLCVQSCPEC